MAINDKEYKIVIEGVDTGKVATQKKNKKEDEPKKYDVAWAARGAAVLASAKQALSFSVQSIGMYTGNTVGQNNIQETMNFAATAIAFSKAPFITGIFMATNAVTTALTKSNAAMWENRQAQRLARRSGNYLSTTTR